MARNVGEGGWWLLYGALGRRAKIQLANHGSLPPRLPWPGPDLPTGAPSTPYSPLLTYIRYSFLDMGDGRLENLVSQRCSKSLFRSKLLGSSSYVRLISPASCASRLRFFSAMVVASDTFRPTEGTGNSPYHDMGNTLRLWPSRPTKLPVSFHSLMLLGTKPSCKPTPPPSDRRVQSPCSRLGLGRRSACNIQDCLIRNLDVLLPSATSAYLLANGHVLDLVYLALLS